MNIKSVGGSGNAYKPQQKEELNDKYGKASAGEGSSASKTDRLDISPEALKFNPIQKRIDEGFYDKPEVIRELAKRISKDLL